VQLVSLANVIATLNPLEQSQSVHYYYTRSNDLIQVKFPLIDKTLQLNKRLQHRKRATQVIER